VSQALLAFTLMICETLAEPMPGARAQAGKHYLPFKARVTLFRYVVGAHEDAVGTSPLPDAPASFRIGEDKRHSNERERGRV